MSASWLPPFPATKADAGRWVTMHGEHVFIENGKITKGPAHLVGKKPHEVHGNVAVANKESKKEPAAAQAKKSPPANQKEILAAVSREANERDLNDAERELSGVNIRQRVGHLPKEVASRFDAHGSGSLHHLMQLLNGGVDPSREFFTSHLPSTDGGEQQGYGTTVRDSSPFVVLGHPGRTIKKGGVAAVMVDPLHEPAIPKLRQAFPGHIFIPAKGAGELLGRVARGFGPVKYGDDK